MARVGCLIVSVVPTVRPANLVSPHVSAQIMTPRNAPASWHSSPQGRPPSFDLPQSPFSSYPNMTHAALTEAVIPDTGNGMPLGGINMDQIIADAIENSSRNPQLFAPQALGFGFLNGPLGPHPNPPNMEDPFVDPMLYNISPQQGRAIPRHGPMSPHQPHFTTTPSHHRSSIASGPMQQTLIHQGSIMGELPQPNVGQYVQDPSQRQQIEGYHHDMAYQQAHQLDLVPHQQRYPSKRWGGQANNELDNSDSRFEQFRTSVESHHGQKFQKLKLTLRNTQLQPSSGLDPSLTRASMENTPFSIRDTSPSTVTSRLVACLNCHANWWEGSCDNSEPCGNCRVLGKPSSKCIRPECTNFDGLSKKGDKCKRAHQNDNYGHTKEVDKLARHCKKDKKKPAPILSDVDGGDVDMDVDG